MTNEPRPQPPLRERALIESARRQERKERDAARRAGGTAPASGGLGPYRIIGEIGRGGMGIVYRAEQSSPRRTVALKVVRGGSFVDEHRIKLFQREVQTLARLKHPEIAAIHDAGCTQDGQHYFAMELVQGMPLNRYVHVQDLTRGQRLELFCRLAAAVHYAHQRGVIHRDLKPSNIIIDESGAPKILDFGLARITDADVAVTTVISEVGKIQGTLPYMSPEQARGNPHEIDIRSDVYALGVLLYEMLAGCLPYDVRSRSLPEAVRVICEHEPRPLTAVSRTLRGDLATIVGKALEKNPSRRYQSAAEIVEDVRRYLSDQPIHARPPSTSYQLRKLVARHKAPAAFILALFLIVTGSAVGMGLLYRDANRLRIRAVEARNVAELEASKAKQVQSFLQNMLAAVDPGQAQGRELSVREVLGAAATRVDAEPLEEPAVEAAIRYTIGRTYQGLGLYDEAERHLRAALSLREVMGAKPDVALAESLGAVGEILFHRGRYGEAEKLFRRALSHCRTLYTDDKGKLSQCVNNLATTLRAQRKLPEAETLLREALALSKTAFGLQHESVATHFNNLGALLYVQGKYGEAADNYRRGLEIRKRVLGDQHPQVAQSMNNLAGALRAQGKLDEAEPLYRRSLAIREAVLGAEHPHLANTLNGYAGLLMEQQRHQAAEEAYRRAYEIRRRTLPDGDWRTANVQLHLGLCLLRQHRFAEAEQYLLEGFRALDESLGPTDKRTLKAANDIAALYEAWDKPKQAAAYRRHATPAEAGAP